MGHGSRATQVYVWWTREHVVSRETWMPPEADHGGDLSEGDKFSTVCLKDESTMKQDLQRARKCFLARLSYRQLGRTACLTGQWDVVCRNAKLRAVPNNEHGVLARKDPDIWHE
ncbi:unnamed protein product [Chondrus crispus]|uniref:Uncharacterized protein n=1 Tax=Chondrus crispus TaxID=2769 RepID=R7Q357_CHOCR|nr:unnamed protein product [Chondrus crispus]CDF32338.1 unnamed protein product [Chondrus crispus]|eukprot:XP_005712003.1 unnamed protein product [Chondrus crispus]